MKPIFLTKAKSFLRITLVGSIALILANCSSDCSPSSQNPLTGYLAATGFDQKLTENINLGDYEFGFSFKPSVNGKITAIVAKIPDAHAGMRVTIWNKATETVLRTESIDVVTAGVAVTKSIDALSITANTEYYITFNSNDWYDHRRTDNSNAAYPYAVGNIIITGYGYNSGTAQDFPNSEQLNYNAGDISFKFVKS